MHETLTADHGKTTVGPIAHQIVDHLLDDSLLAVIDDGEGCAAVRHSLH